MKYDKQYNVEFYGETVDVDYIKWIRENSSDTEPVALRIPINTWGYLWEGSPYRATHWAEPLDPSLALWSIAGNSSFASYRTLIIKSTQNTLSVSITTQDNPEQVPLAMDARSNSQGYTSVPIYRLAYDETFSYGLYYPDSYYVYDISYKDVVLEPVIHLYNTELEEDETFSNLDSLFTYLQDNYENIGNSVTVMLNYNLYFGTQTPRSYESHGKNETNGYFDFNVVMNLDVLIDKTIPDDDELKHNYRQNYPWDTEDPTRRDDVVYQPFEFMYSELFYRHEDWRPTYPRVYAGYYVDLTHSQISSGAYPYKSNNSEYISAFTGRMSTVNRQFEDVAYHWEDAVYNTYTHEFVDDGYLMIAEPTSAVYKFISKIVIDDAKNHSIPESIVNAIKHEYAYLGFYFADNTSIATNKITGSETDGIGLYLPNRTFNIPDGTYVTGSDIANSPYADADTTDDLSPIDPDDETYKDKTPALNNQSLNIEGVHMYSLVNLPGLIANINSIPVRDQDSDLYTDRLFFGADPYEYILGYGLVPLFFVPQAYIDEGELDYITLGKYQSTAAFGASEIKAINRTLKIPLRRMLIQPTKIPYEFNNFLDFEPYTTLSLYLPFAGTIDLPPSIFVGHSISVYSSLDLLAGTVTYIIYADNIQYTTVTCNVRVEMPIHGADISAYSELMVRTAAEKRSALFNMNANIGATLGRAGASFGISAVSGNVIAGIASSIGGAMSLSGYFGDVINQMQLYNTVLTRTSPTPISISSGSMPDGFANTLTPYISRTVPRYASGFKTEVYGKLNGFACYINDVISNYHGFTVIENPILDDLPISAKEKEMLRKALSQGVILP